MEQLKQAMYAYNALDDRLSEVNRTAIDLRTQRKELETMLTHILTQPEFQGIDKLQSKEDNSYIRIGRPDTWTKPWSLSKKELETMLSQYFQRTNAPSAEDCFKYICDSQRKPGKEFVFERVKRKNE